MFHLVTSSIYRIYVDWHVYTPPPSSNLHGMGSFIPPRFPSSRLGPEVYLDRLLEFSRKSPRVGPPMSVSLREISFSGMSLNHKNPRSDNVIDPIRIVFCNAGDTHAATLHDLPANSTMKSTNPVHGSSCPSSFSKSTRPGWTTNSTSPRNPSRSSETTVRFRLVSILISLLNHRFLDVESGIHQTTKNIFRFLLVGLLLGFSSNCRLSGISWLFSCFLSLSETTPLLRYHSNSNPAHR